MLSSTPPDYDQWEYRTVFRYQFESRTLVRNVLSENNSDHALNSDLSDPQILMTDFRMKHILFSFIIVHFGFLLVAVPMQAQVVHGYEDSSFNMAIWLTAILAGLVILFVGYRCFKAIKVPPKEKQAIPSRAPVPSEVRQAVDKRLDTEVALIRAMRARSSDPSGESSLKIREFLQGSLAKLATEPSVDHHTEPTGNIFFLDLPEQARRWDLGQFWENVFHCHVDMLTSAVQRENSIEINQALEGLVKLLKHDWKPYGPKLFELRGTLPSLGDDYKPLVEQVSSLLSNANAARAR